MASRRQRFKAVVNIPVRRGRNDQSEVEAVNLPDHHTVEETKKGSIEQSPSNIADHELGQKIDTQEIDHDNIATDLPSKETSSPKTFSRKRLKPSVNLPAIIRKPKETITVNADAAGVPSDDIRRDVPSILSEFSRLPSDNLATVSNSNSVADSTSSCSKDDNVLDDSSHGFSSAQSAQSEEASSSDQALKPSVSTRPKFVKPTPRLVDASTRRNSQTASSDPDDIKKQPEFARPRLPSSKTAGVLDISGPRETETTNPLDDRLAPVNAPPSSCDGTISAPSEYTSDIDPIQKDSKSEKRTAHRRIRKNGAVEMLTRARQDFQNKFGDKTPEKDKLRMFDFIFYNPSTNPMKVSDVKDNTAKDKLVAIEDDVAERLADESVDDVAEMNEDDKPKPAPQVKVGPDGSLIVDEQSLLIETTGSRKRKNDMANSAVVVDYGQGNATYNSFSNKVKTKEWSKADTFKFYRALHSIGTDFLLMQSIFPNRTRKDLKQKFKKEDRLNRNLVDKALRNPLQFDISKLEEDIAREEKEEEERLEAAKKEKELAKSLAAEDKKQKGRKISVLAKSNSEESGTKYPKRKIQRRKVVKEAETNLNLAEAPVPDATVEHTKPTSAKPKSRTKRLKKSKECDSNDESSTSCSSDEFDMYAETAQKSAKVPAGSEDAVTASKAPSKCSSARKLELPRVLTTADDIDVSSTDDEDVFLKKTVQTRYGRIPLRRIRSNSSGDDDIIEEQQLIAAANASGESSEACCSPVPDVSVSLEHPDLSNVEPGSLVILTTPGKKTFKLFMVGPKGNGSTENKISHIPVTITPEMFATLSANNLVAGNAIIPVNDCTAESVESVDEAERHSLSGMGD